MITVDVPDRAPAELRIAVPDVVVGTGVGSLLDDPWPIKYFTKRTSHEIQEILRASFELGIPDAAALAFVGQDLDGYLTEEQVERLVDNGVNVVCVRGRFPYMTDVLRGIGCVSKLMIGVTLLLEAKRAVFDALLESISWEANWLVHFITVRLEMLKRYDRRFSMKTDVSYARGVLKVSLDFHYLGIGWPVFVRLEFGNDGTLLSQRLQYAEAFPAPFVPEPILGVESPPVPVHDIEIGGAVVGCACVCVTWRSMTISPSSLISSGC